MYTRTFVALSRRPRRGAGAYRPAVMQTYLSLSLCHFWLKHGKAGLIKALCLEFYPTLPTLRMIGPDQALGNLALGNQLGPFA